MTLFAFTLLSLAAWRVAMIVSVDSIGDPFRRAVALRWKPVEVPLRDGRGDEVVGTATLRPAWVTALVNCPSCTDVWTAGAGVLLLHAAGLCDQWRWVALAWLAAAGVGVLLSDVSERLSR